MKMSILGFFIRGTVVIGFFLVSLTTYGQEAMDSTLQITPVKGLDSLNISTGASETVNVNTTTTPADTLKLVQVQNDSLSLDSLSIELEEPKPKVPFFTSLDIGLDYLKFSSLLVDYETKYEGEVSMVFKGKIRASLEAGYGKLEPEKAFKNAQYEVEGTYWRVGLEYILPLDLKNSFFIGLKYGKSSFGDKGEFEIGSELWENFIQGFDRDKLTADWGEIVIGSEMRVIPNLFMGWKFRLRILNNFENFEPIEVYTIPGYGRTFDNTVPALNLFVRYRFKFKRSDL